MLGSGSGLILAASVALQTISIPVYRDFATSAAGDPTVPTHAIGTLMVGSILRTGGTASVPSTGGWTFWDAGASAGNAWSIYWKIALSTSEIWGTWSQTGRRNLYLFDNAQIGFVSGFTGTGTTCAWPALNGGGDLGGRSLVASELFCSTAQTSLVGKAPAALTSIRLSGSTTAIAADGGATDFTTWAAPGNATLDTAANHAGLTFSVRGA